MAPCRSLMFKTKEKATHGNNLRRWNRLGTPLLRTTKLRKLAHPLFCEANENSGFLMKPNVLTMIPHVTLIYDYG